MLGACEVCAARDDAEILTLTGPTGSPLSYLQCAGCGLVRLDTEEIYDYNDPDYVEVLTRQALSGERLWQWTLDLIEAHQRPGVLVEVGCGVGTQLSAARKRGWTVRGFDINADCPTIARLMHGVDVRSQDFLTQPEDAFADVVLMHQLIEHVPDPVPFLEASRRALKPGGVLVMSTPNWNAASPLAWVARRTGAAMPRIDHIKPDQHIRLYSPKTFAVLAQRQGWTLRGLYDNPTDYLGNRGPLSPRTLLGRLSRGIAAMTRQKTLVGMSMVAVLSPAP